VAEDFLSGTTGAYTGRRAVLADAFCDAMLAARRLPARLARDAAREPPRRRVLALTVETGSRGGAAADARTELLRSRHEVEVAAGPVGDRGKFENLNLMLARRDLDAVDWLLVLDDDVVLPGGFVDALVLLAERFAFSLAQPAHRRRSHAAWEVTRRRPGLLARRTAFVEIGPVTAFHRDTFGALLPFPELRYGWGLDLHWAALARDRGWRLGVLDALPVAHALAPVAGAYPAAAAIEEARAFLADRPYLPAAEAQRTLERHW
jgi:GT2 family glycosyltransferase